MGEEAVVGKKRIVSTVILSILLFFAVMTAISFVTINASMINEAAQSAADNTEPGGKAIAAGMVGLVASIGIVMVMIIYGLLVIESGICLIFTIRNRKSILLPVRIISYVLDAGFGAVLGLSIVKIILLVAGV